MTETAMRVAVEFGVANEPAVEKLLTKPPGGFVLTCCARAAVLDEDADIVLISADAADEVLDHRQAEPDSSRRSKVLVLGPAKDAAFCELAVLKGAAGVLDRASSADLVAKALFCIAQGELWLDRRTTGRVFERLSRSLVRKRRSGRATTSTFRLRSTVS